MTSGNGTPFTHGRLKTCPSCLSVRLKTGASHGGISVPLSWHGAGDRRALSPAAQDYLRHFQKWIASLTQAGKISSCGPLSQRGRTLAGPKALMTDGPFVEAKDLIGGYTVISAENLDTATEIARGCPFLLVGGTVEIRPVLSVK
jgi:hypothetical protein